MIEFTGERVIPGQVNDDLWSEHVARYAFARRFAEGRRVLDAGCGAGYGAAELALAAKSVVGIDLAPEAIEYARSGYSNPKLGFVVGSCAATPFHDGAFDLLAAFEVIEHLADYRTFLSECARVTTPEGLAIISSPNKRYYAESRAKTGPNPYHEHEFEPEEFVSELQRVFANVRLVLQDRLESFAFHPAAGFWPAEARIDGGGIAEQANFLIGLCSNGPLPELRSFLYVPRAANLLREREQHIALLEDQLARTRGWLAETQGERDSLMDLFKQQSIELEERHKWALDLAAELEGKGQRVIELQNEFAAEQRAGAEMAAAYESKLRETEDEVQARTKWALDTEARLTADLQGRMRELAECVRLLDAAEATVQERTAWANRVNSERARLARQVEMIRASRWLRLGRRFGLGPAIDPSE